MTARELPVSDPRAAPMVVGEAIRLGPLVVRVTQDNPGMYTGPGTNTHLIGDRELIVLDPGEDRDPHFTALERAIDDRPVRAIIPSHAHPDHWPLAHRLAQRFEAPVLAFGARGEFTPDRTVSDGERIEIEGRVLTVLHTPGHASDHICLFSRADRTLFTGDLVMGWSTSIIAPPDGNLRQYQASLERLLELDLHILYPAHGAAILSPHQRIRELHAHRRERTRQALDALAQGPDTPAGLVAMIYADVDPKLHGAARMSLLAHLEALIEDGRVECLGDDPLSAEYRLR